MLAPQHVWRTCATDDAVWILRLLFVGQLGRHIVSAHAPGTERPCGAAILGAPGAAAGNANEQLRTVAWINTDAVDPGHIITTAKPFRTRRFIPQALHQLPRIAAV